jgi:hypothetical protein
MPPYKEPSFQDRAAMAQQARQKALDQLKAKEPVDPAILEQRRAARAAKERKLADDRAAKAAATAAAKAEQDAALAAKLAEAEAAAASKAASMKLLTPEAVKAARDARYAARKARQ